MNWVIKFIVRFLNKIYKASIEECYQTNEQDTEE